MRVVAIRGLLSTAVIVAAAAVPASSSAATVQVGSGCLSEGGQCLELKAAPGEANKATVTFLSDTQARVEDTGAPLTPGQGCTPNGANQATCTTDAGTTWDDVFAQLDDGDDSFTIVGGSPSIESDLRGGDGADTLTGGPGRDGIDGGLGADVLHGGAGDDSLDGGDVAGDVLDGGPGSDTADYSGRQDRLTLDLDQPGAAGAAGENDRLSGIENLNGGEAADRIGGDAGANKLYGGSGKDVVEGRGGDDVVYAPDGRADGGAGDDTIEQFLAKGTVVCGPGRDLLGAGKPGRRVPADCESVALSVADDNSVFDPGAMLSSRGPLRVKGNVAYFRLRCSAAAPSKTCGGRLTIKAGGATAGPVRTAVPRGKRLEVGVPLPASVIKRIKGKGVTGTVLFQPPNRDQTGYTTPFKL